MKYHETSLPKRHIRLGEPLGAHLLEGVLRPEWAMEPGQRDVLSLKRMPFNSTTRPRVHRGEVDFTTKGT